ncbi:hypothetical protein F441_22391 [Phytophthora nicotianae CJ01A1]|uniref:Uncharacterized protein n=3 Tax=Phytophthora nicotianae TaxID=4792 RepID=V9DUY2_PHYNI|nr:hypothetical protein F443_23050 [Phytophthora nicotianae P1569]ETK73033.1 hypothetical protein L915_19989 [Phytophthora nicotianae]ETL35579.1 hypothetical protein L916_12305 [Phytophthora nicotianae]ETM32935.1 hypothetical protein L914_19770 [Phytophthora nicotianae]ETP00191.1 hypothetical protein F441_22391 [Phytophthora nicotianae CJ01A1]
MDEKTLARELIRARLDELADMKQKLETLNGKLGKLLKLQLEFHVLIEDSEERCYALAAALDCKDESVQDGVFSFGLLLEMVVNKLKG